jgi:CheY-like chemotaxis protein
VVTQRLEGIERVDPGSYAVIEVEDTGCGIPEEHLSRVLEPFFTSRRRAGSTGTGLGLTIVHRIVKDASGYLRVESKVGRGTTFGLYFPALVGRAGAVSERPPPVASGRGRILVVDDEVVQLRAARRILMQLGYEVVTAGSAEVALELFGAQPGRFDLVVMDVLLAGGMGGMEAAVHMRAIRAEQPIVLVSGWASEELGHAAREPGITSLAKPYAVSDLGAAVKTALGASAVRPASVRPVERVSERHRDQPTAERRGDGAERLAQNHPEHEGEDQAGEGVAPESETRDLAISGRK